jgi:hypothetical protein
MGLAYYPDRDADFATICTSTRPPLETEKDRELGQPLRKLSPSRQMRRRSGCCGRTQARLRVLLRTFQFMISLSLILAAILAA